MDVASKMLELKPVNTMVSQLSSFADQVTRMARGREGRLGGQAPVDGVSGPSRTP
ncbi:HAMP domain-containing protein [Streptomyces tanashiensis]